MDARVYRNWRMALILGVFALIVLGLILGQALSSSTPTGARFFGLILVAVLALYVARAMRVEVRVSEDRVRIRNILTTRTIPWSQVATVDAVPSRGSRLSPAYSVIFRLRDGRVLPAQALRRSSSDATTIASDLTSRFVSAPEGQSVAT